MIVDGKEIARKIEMGLIEKFSLSGISKKKVCFVLFSDNVASRKFIDRKTKVAERLGISVTVMERTNVTTTYDCLLVIGEIVSQKYDGIVIQLPIPKDVKIEDVLNAIPVEMDVDVLSENGKKAFASGLSVKIPPVARAVWEILHFYSVNLENKKILIVGNGRLVGEPVGLLLSVKHIPFKIIDINTSERERMDALATADIIITGVGMPHMITPDMIRAGVMLIDAGTSEQGGVLVGDIDPRCADKARVYTPVPGGVGPVTVICLFSNLF